MLTGDSLENVIRIHYEGGGLISKSTAIFIILAAIASISTGVTGFSRRPTTLLIIASLFLLIGYFINFRASDWLQLKNVTLTIIVLALTLFPAMKERKLEELSHPIYTTLAILLLTAMFVVAFVETFTLRTWSVFMDSTGALIRRSSSMLFNPNLYGMWCAILAIAFSFLYTLGRIATWKVVFALTLAYSGIFLAGSRSAAIMLLLILLASALLTKKNTTPARFLPAGLMIITFVSITSFSRLLSFRYPHISAWTDIATLGERFAAYPVTFTAYFVNQLGIGEITSIPPEITTSIEGRFSGELKDAGWLVLYDDTGWLGVIAMVSVWLMLTRMAFRTYLRLQDACSAYALSVLAFTVGLGAILRFQAFPTGVFMAIALAPCVSYWMHQNSMERSDA